MKFDKIINEAQEDMGDAFGKMMGATETLGPASDLRWPHSAQKKQIEDIGERLKTIHTNLRELIKILSNDSETIFDWADKTYTELMDKEDEGTMTPGELQRFNIAVSVNTLDEALIDYADTVKRIVASTIKI
jgi:hypothetical protein